METFLYYLFLASLCNHFSYALVIEKKCPNVEPIDNFNVSAFGQGIWHERTRYSNEFENTNCKSFEAAPYGDRIKMKFINSLNVSEDSPDYIATVCGLAPGFGSKGVLQHEITFGNPPTVINLLENFLAFDGDKFYISYTCYYDEKTESIKEYAWVASRTKDIDDKLKELIDNFIKSSNILDASKFIWLDSITKTC